MRPKALLLFIIAINAALVLSAGAEVVFRQMPSVVAKVGGVEISTLRFSKAVKNAESELSKKVWDIASDISSVEVSYQDRSDRSIKAAVLSQLIDDLLIDAGAKAEGIKVSEGEISEEIGRLKKNFPSSAEFHRSIAEQGMTVLDLRKTVSKQLIIKKLEEILMGRVVVSDEEIKVFYEKNIEIFIQPKQVRVSNITVQSEDKAKELLSSVRSGTDFGEIAKIYSKDDLSREKGGDMGLISIGDLPPELEKAAFLLKVGEISDIIASDDGYHLIKVTDRISGKEATLADSKENIRGFLLKEKGTDAFYVWLSEQRNAAKIEINEDLKGIFRGGKA